MSVNRDTRIGGISAGARECTTVGMKETIPMKLHGFFLALGLVTVAAGPVHADRFFCIGAETEGNWSDAGNWRTASDCTGLMSVSSATIS